MYELYYSHGGHGGPYETFDDAVETAERLIEGNKSSKPLTVEIRPRHNNNVVGGYKPNNANSSYVWKGGDGDMMIEHI